LSGENTSKQYYDDYFTENIETPLMSSFTETALPQLRSQMNKKGLLYGSGREENEQNLAGNLMQTLAQSKTNLALEMDKNNKANALTAANTLGTLSSDAVSNLTKLNALGVSGVAGQDYANKQSILTNQYNDWLSQQPGSRPQDAMLMQLLGADASNTIVDKSATTNATNMANVLAMIGMMMV
jgi:hypothetical protein